MSTATAVRVPDPTVVELSQEELMEISGGGELVSTVMSLGRAFGVVGIAVAVGVLAAYALWEITHD